MALLIISKTLPIAPVGRAYSEQLQAAEGIPPYEWTVVSGSLPPGMVLSTSGLLTAAIGAIPANATGNYVFRLRVRDAAVVDVFYDYNFEVAPAAYERVTQFLLDDRIRLLFGNLLLTSVTREKVERHFFRDLIGAVGTTYAHTVDDIQVPDWVTLGNDVGLRFVLNSLQVSSLAALKTINSIAPDISGNFDLVAGNGIALTGQPTGVRIDVIAGAAGGIQEANVEADVAPGGNQSLVVPELPDVVEVWMRDEFDASWNRLSDMSEGMTKKVVAPTSVDPESSSCAVGCDSTGAIPFFFTCHYDATGPELVLNKYHGETMVFIESAVFALSGIVVGEPLLMINRAAPYEPIVAVVTGAPGSQVLEYVEFSDPDNIAGAAVRSAIFNAIDLDVNAIEFLPNEVTGYKSSNVGQIFGTIIDDGSGVTAVLAPKISVSPGGIGKNHCVFLQIPIGVATPVISVAASLNTLNSDTLDIVFDGTVIPNGIFILNSTGRWTNAGGTLDIWKTPSAGWTPLPVPQTGALAGLPAAAWTQSITTVTTDGMEIPKAMLALDIDSTAKDAVGIIYVHDVYHALATLVTPVGPDMHSPSLECKIFDNVATGPLNLLGSVTLDQQPSAGLDFTADGRFGRWFTDVDEASVFYIDPKRMPGRVFTRTALFDVTGLKAHVENSSNYADPSASLSSSGLVRSAHSTYGPSTFIRAARATALFDTVAASVLALDSGSKPNPFHAYFDGGTNVVFKNDSPFEWHIKIEALLNEVEPSPPNLSVACWQLAQGLQNYYNANAFFPSASCNPPGPGGVQGTVWDESEAGLTVTATKTFYPMYYSVLPGTWDLCGGTKADAFYYSTGSPGISTSMWLVFRYILTPSTILAAEAVIAPVLTTGPLPAPGVYSLAQIAAAMGHPEWVTNYSGAPFEKYQYFCFVNWAGTGYYHGWFSQNYINNAQVYGPGAPGVEPSIPFVEKFTMAADAVTNVATDFVISRACRYAEVSINGIAYWQGDDWEFGTTMNKIRYMNYSTPGYVLHQNDRVVIKYIV